MDLTPHFAADAKVIQGYGEGGFRISNDHIEGPVLVLPDRVLPWSPPPLADFDETVFAPLEDSEAEIEVLLLGTGADFGFVPPKLRRQWSARGLSVEPMDTGAACRTYNVLMAEARRVAAALIPVP